ncbi:PIR Superfamily Protein [Plasmodium malariae]|uniref:PIR Superfamily Protein n=1 Tax=Plasmodium malariae TaxID=5858 RepID=A0A1A8X642_PLAMA|nr:PIR Superfamily Protein [Plasmodium malariae]
MTLQYKKEWDDLLKDLPANKLYEDFREGDTSKTSRIECDDKSNTEKLKPIILANLRKVNDGKNMKCSNCKDCCLNFTYWMYDEIRKLIRCKNNKINVSDFIGKLSIEGNDINNKANKCPCSNYYLGDLNEMNKEKDLHDYFKNFDELEGKCSNNPNKKLCDEYTKYISNIYKENYFGCCFFYEYGLEDCEYFKCDDYYNPSNILDIINGKVKNLKKKPEKSQTRGNQADPNQSQERDPNVHLLTCSKDLGVGRQAHCILSIKASERINRDSENTVNGPLGTSGSAQMQHESSVEVTPRAQATRNTRAITHETTEYGIKILPSLLMSRNVGEITSARNESGCVSSLSNKEKGVSCIEPDVRTTGTLGLRIERLLPISTIKIARWTKIPSYLNIQESTSSILTSTFFRVGISACLVVGILMLFLIYYKFTPFRSRIRSRKSTRKRIRYDDYDDYPTVIFGKISAPRRRHTKNIRILERNTDEN